MKRIRFGNVLDVEQGIIAHGCNAQGVMGSGVAAGIKQRFPQAYNEYREFIAKHHGLSPLGKVNLVSVADGLWVANAITQENFGRDPTKRYCNYEAIHSVFKIIAGAADLYKTSVHYPLIGAGLANGDWSIISELIDDAFRDYPSVDRTLWIYEP